MSTPTPATGLTITGVLPENVPGGKWKFIPWDAEWSFGNNGRNVTGNNLSSGPLAGDADIARFYRALQKNPEFRMRFADRVQIHYFNGGALTNENVLRRFREMKETMSVALRNLNTQVESTWVPRRRDIVMSQMASQKIQFSNTHRSSARTAARFRAVINLS